MSKLFDPLTMKTNDEDFIYGVATDGHGRFLRKRNALLVIASSMRTVWMAGFGDYVR